MVPWAPAARAHSSSSRHRRRTRRVVAVDSSVCGVEVSLSPKALHLIGQDGIPWRGVGIVLLTLGGVVFLLLCGMWIGLRLLFHVWARLARKDHNDEESRKP